MADQKYRRLTRTRARSQFAVAFMARSRLWLGNDHLLLVDTNGYTETYKRFYFRDIQAVSIRRTTRHRWLAAIAGFFALLFLGLTLAVAPKTSPAQWSADEIAGGSVLGGIAGFFALLVLLNFLFGPACRCFLRTAVQTEELPPLCRVRQTRKVLDKIRPLIVAAQGQFTAEEVSARMQETLLAANPTRPPEPSAPGSVPPVMS